MAVSYFAGRPINISGTQYEAGDIVDVSGWSSSYLSTASRLGWVQGISTAAVSSVGGGGGAGGTAVSSVEPSTHYNGMLWTDPATGATKWYDDTDSTWKPLAGSGSTASTVGPANLIVNTPNGFNYEDWHITWAGGSMSDFYGLQTPSELIAAYPLATDPNTGYLSIMIFPGHVAADVILHDSYSPWPPPGVMNWVDAATGWEPTWGGDPGVQPAGDYTIVVQHSPPSETTGQYKPHLLTGMEFAGGSLQTGGAGGGGTAFVDSYKGVWADGPFASGDVVNHQGSLYVATYAAVPGDVPGATAGDPVYVGGNNVTAQGYFGGPADTFRYQDFTVTASTDVDAVQMHGDPNQFPLRAGHKVRLTLGDHTTVLAEMTLTVDDFAPVLSVPARVSLSPGVTYAVGSDSNSLTSHQSAPIDGSDGVVVIGNFNGSNVTSTPFGLYQIPLVPSPWVRVIKGVG